MMDLIRHNMVHALALIHQLSQLLCQLIISIIVLCLTIVVRVIVIRILLLLLGNLFRLLAFLCLSGLILSYEVFYLCILVVLVTEEWVLITDHPTNRPYWSHLGINCLLILDPAFIKVRTRTAHDPNAVISFCKVISSAEVALLVDIIAAITDTVHHIAECDFANKDVERVVGFIRVRVVQR
jgi:hypothetical protein